MCTDLTISAGKIKGRLLAIARKKLSYFLSGPREQRISKEILTSGERRVQLRKLKRSLHDSKCE